MPSSTKQKILETALTLFNERGYGNVKISDVADELGMSVGNLWYHYKDRRSILEAQTSRFYEDAVKRMAIRPEGNDVIKEFVSFIDAWFQEVAKFRFLYRDQADFGSYGKDATEFLPKVHSETINQFSLFIEEMKRQDKMAIPNEKIIALAELFSLQVRYSLEFYREGSAGSEPYKEMEQKSKNMLCFLAETFMTSTAAYEFRETVSKTLCIEH